MPVPTTTSGKKAKVIIGTTPAAVAWAAKWSVDEDRDDLDITVAEDNGFGNTEAGVRQCSIMIDGFYFVGQNPIAPFVPTPSGTDTDDVVKDLKIYGYKDGADVSDPWVFPLASVLKLSMGSEVRGKISFSVSLKSKGTFTRPAA